MIISCDALTAGDRHLLALIFIALITGSVAPTTASMLVTYRGVVPMEVVQRHQRVFRGAGHLVP
jgi:hypothetical protein